jgi:hypothetical protein
VRERERKNEREMVMLCVMMNICMCEMSEM